MKNIEKCLKEMITWVKTDPSASKAEGEIKSFNNIYFMIFVREGKFNKSNLDEDQTGVYNGVRYVREQPDFSIYYKGLEYFFGYQDPNADWAALEE